LLHKQIDGGRTGAGGSCGRKILKILPPCPQAPSLSLIILLVALRSAQAAGGACPTGANYLNPANPAGPKVTLTSLGVTSCYYISASTNSSDNNDGISELTPWQHAPGMPNCKSGTTCGNTTPQPGNGFIFRGGDMWHTGNPNAIPSTGGTWSWSWSGTSNNHIYIGVDPTWYSGSAWARPIINGDNPLNSVSGGNAGVASCAYGGGGASLVSLSPARYEHFDNFELLGMCWGTGGGSFIYTNGVSATYTQGSPNPNPRWIENNYIHGWSHVKFTGSTGVSASNGGGITGSSGEPVNGSYYGSIIQFNVIDGSDSDSYSLSWSGGQGDTWIVQYNVVRYNGGDNSPLSTHLFHDNLFEYGYNADDGQSHTDWPLQNYGSEPNGGTFPGDGTPNLFYNNIVRHIPLAVSSVLWQFPQGSLPDYDFNNIFEDYEGAAGSNYNDFCQGSCGAMVVFNNTEEGAGAPSNPGGCIYCNAAGDGTITAVNNHWITNDNSAFTTMANVTESAAIYQTLSATNAQGYALANNFAPTASSNATVTASGSNETNGYCAAITDTLGHAACLQGITSVSYNSTNHTVIYPANTPVARPTSGPWNAGAYQFSSGTISPCDVNGDGVVNVVDVQLEVNMALGIGPCTNPSGTCTVVSVQRVVNAALAGSCVSP
jgi:hypothetical protein